ncbi:AAA family ATPase [Streptomyces sp. NPDC087532]|uniref:AAA family ATPase n=1 Tax=Streptomyces sp. NPDC087532 TaxID=3365795 RepID=UPI003826FF58
MIVWLNGPFGAGKTTLSQLLHQQIQPSIVTDPEEVGFLLRRSLGDHTTDFQDYPMWRSLVAEVCIALHRHVSGDPVIVPMALLRREYAEEIHGALRQAGIEVRHFVLHADSTTIRARIDASMEFPGNETRSAKSRAFRRRKIPDYEQAYECWLQDQAEVIDTSALIPEQVAEQVFSHLNRP